MLGLAERLGVTDADPWAAGVLANAERSSAADGEQLLQAARMLALGRQLESPARPPALSVAEIRQLANQRASTQSTDTSAASTQTRVRDRRSDGVPASPRLTRARLEWAQALPVLTGTALRRGDQLSPAAISRLNAARQALAREVDQPLASIEPATAALKVLSDHWTARIEREPGAFERARAAQSALTRAMAPQRAQAAQQRASLANKQAEYDATIALIRVLEPGFEEARIGAAKLGDVTLSQLESSVPSRMSAEEFAQLKLDVARQYLTQYQTQYQTRTTAAAAEPASNATERFIDALPPERRKSWEMQLIGGLTLRDVVATVARRGGALTLEGVDKAVRSARSFGPARFSVSAATVAEDRFHEIRYDSLDDFRIKLRTALQDNFELPMQIRSADGSTRLDLYRHGNERGGTTIIDQRDGSALAQPNGLEAAIVKALGIERAQYGAVVVSYASSAASAVMVNNPRLYTSAAEAVQQGIDVPESRSQVSTAPLRRQIEERTSTPARRLERLESDYTAFSRSLDARRSESRAGDIDAYVRLQRSALKLRDAAPGVVGERAGGIAQEAECLWYADLALRGFVSDGLLSPEAARGSIDSGLTTVGTILRRHGIPQGYATPPDAPSLLRFAIEIWDSIRWNAIRGYPSYLPELNGLAQTEQIRIMSSPLRFLEWLSRSATDWSALLDSAEFE